LKLLITNDDGINSLGIKTLVKELEGEHEILIVAPENQMSASSHSITIHRPIIVKEVNMPEIKSRGFSVNGTPADCVKVALDKLLDGGVDMIISGINNGYNLGTDVIYSGTVSAAIEGAIYKVPSMAVSAGDSCDIEGYVKAAEYVKEILNNDCINSIGNDIVLNINVPTGEKKIKGIKVCQLGSRTYSNCYIETLDLNFEKTFQLKGTVTDSTEKTTDVFLIKNGYVTVTPLHYDLTNFKIIEDIKKWFE
jgi:5'-nucleotidase